MVLKHCMYEITPGCSLTLQLCQKDVHRLRITPTKPCHELGRINTQLSPLNKGSAPGPLQSELFVYSVLLAQIQAPLSLYSGCVYPCHHYTSPPKFNHPFGSSCVTHDTSHIPYLGIRSVSET